MLIFGTVIKNPGKRIQKVASRRLFLLWVLSFIIVSASGGTPFFSSLSMRDGLPSNIIAAMAQDKYGFIWVATGSGLARYDGYNFKIFKRGEKANTIPSNELSSI